MPDFDAIADAIADRYAPGVTTPAKPSGVQDVRVSTADIPNKPPALPCVLVFTDRGSFGSALQTRLGVATFRVQFLLRTGADLARDEKLLRRWLTVLVNRLAPPFVALGGVVTRAHVTSWTSGRIRFGGETYSGLELVVEAVTSEAWPS